MDNNRTILSSALAGDQRSEVSAVLVEARALIERPECWGNPDHPGAHCAQTATGRKSGAEGTWRRAMAVFREANGIEGGSVADIWRWNDAPERTHAEVLAAFDKAIDAVGDRTHAPANAE